MKRLILAILCVILLCAHSSAKTSFGISTDMLSAAVFGEVAPLVVYGDPPPAEDIDLLVAEGYLTSEERDLIWDAYYNGVDEDEKFTILRLISRIWDRIQRNAWARTGALMAAERVGEYICDNFGGGGGGSQGACPGNGYSPMMNQ